MKSLGQILSAHWRQADRRPIAEYASEHVQLFPPITRPGLFDCSSSRHFLDPLAGLDNERTREVNVLKPVRGGGSLIGDVHLAVSLARDPASFLNVFQTDADAKAHWFDRLEKVLKGCAAAAALLPERYEWSEIHLRDGSTLYTGGPGMSNLQSKGVRYLRLDECWIYPLGRMTEAEARVGDYQRMELSKILRISQGGAAPDRMLHECDWHRAWLRGERNEWEVACRHCGKYFDPIFSGTRADGSFWGITWDQHRLANGDWSLAKCIPTIRFECPHCAQPILDSKSTREEWNRTGRYRLASDPNPRARGFHWEAVIDFPWADLVALWLDAANAFSRGDLQPKIQFYQKRRALFRDEESILKGGLQLKRAAYEIHSDWPEEKVRFMSIDRQEEDVFWWSVRAWSDEKSRRLGFGKAFGFAECETKRELFKVAPNHVFIDSAFVPRGDHGVYAACCRYGWIAVRGDNSYFFIHHDPKRKRRIQRSYAPPTKGDPGMGTAKERQRFANLILFSKPQMNQVVQSLIDSGRWEEPITGERELEEEYAAQMASRVKRVEYSAKTGEARIYWKEGKNDHARDLANMQALGAILDDRLPDPAEERLAPSEKAQG